MRSWIVVVVLAACGGGKSPALEAPKRPAGPSCEGVADAMVGQLVAGMDPRPPDTTVDPIRNIISKRCTADAWTMEAKQCLSTMKTAADVEHCAALLTEEQQAALTRDQSATFGEPKPKPTPEAPADAPAAE